MIRWLIRFSILAGAIGAVGMSGHRLASGDSLRFVGFGTISQGATFTETGATDQWPIRSGLDGHTEVIHLSNGAAVNASDYLFV